MMPVSLRWYSTRFSINEKSDRKWSDAIKWILPSSVQMPVCPMKGRIHVIGGNGLQTIQHYRGYKWGEVRWVEVKWSEVKWGEVRWGEAKWGRTGNLWAFTSIFELSSSIRPIYSRGYRLVTSSVPSSCDRKDLQTFKHLHDTCRNTHGTDRMY